MAKVSIVIPTYNRQEFLRSAIASVLNQTFQDFEVIVVDDASRDITSAVVTSFSDKRIKYVRHLVNKGASAARNTGILHSDSAYIAFLDDDDEWLPDKLKRQVDLLDNADLNVGVVYTGYDIVDKTTGAVLSQIVPMKRGDLSKELLAENCLGGASSILLRRECFDQVGLFDDSLPPLEDYDLWIRISTLFHFDYIKDPLLRYYVHSEEISANPDTKSNGLKMLLKKYGTSKQLRKYCSYHYLDVGVIYCYRGSLKNGRAAFLRAISLYPFEVRYYFYLFVSFLGLHLFKKIKEGKEKAFERLSFDLNKYLVHL